MSEIYKPKITDVFTVTTKDSPDGTRMSAIMYVKSFVDGVPLLIRIAGSNDIKDDLIHDVIKDQLTDDSLNRYEYIHTTNATTSKEALRIAKQFAPEYFI